MAFGFSKTRLSPIAIDFGADSIKLLQIVPGDPPQLVAAASALVPEDARKDPQARQVFMADALRQLLRSQPFKGKKVICSLPAYQTLVHHLEVPRTDEADLLAQVKMQLRQRLEVEPGKMVIRHFPITQVMRDGAALQEVLCLAAGRDTVMNYVQMCAKAKLDVVGMHGEQMAILRAFDHLHRGDEQRALCFIDIGSAATKVVIAHGRKIVFAKTIHIAGDHMTRQVAGMREMNFTDARATRIAEADNPQAASPSSAASPAGSAINAPTGLAMLDARTQPRQAPAAAAEGELGADTLECLVDELQLCLRYHQTLFPKHPIEKLVFLGGEAKQVKTCQTIARALRVAAQLGDPLARLSRVGSGKAVLNVDMDQPQPGWAVPMGLCLSEANL